MHLKNITTSLSFEQLLEKIGIHIAFEPIGLKKYSHNPTIWTHFLKIIEKNEIFGILHLKNIRMSLSYNHVIEKYSLAF